MKSLITKKNGSVIDFSVNAKELTTEELKTKVNGGSALTPEQQAKMAEMTKNGDFSYLNELTGNNKDEEKKVTGGDDLSSNSSSVITKKKTVYTSAEDNRTESGDNLPGSNDENIETPDDSSNRSGSESTRLSESIPDFTKDETYSESLDNDDETESNIENENSSVRDRLLEKARKRIGNKYVASSNPDSQFQCDNFGQAVFDDAGVDWSGYYAGKATDFNIQNHIDNALETGKTKKTERYAADDLSQGAYVVFMNDGKICGGSPLRPHTGLLFVNDESCSYIDNSAGNPNGGVYEQVYDTVAGFQSDYGYSSFYYQKIE